MKVEEDCTRSPPVQLCDVGFAEIDDELYQCLGSASCCDINSISLLAQNLGAVGEKVTNTVETTTLLENKLQNTERDVLDQRNQTAGNSRFFYVGFNAGI